MRTLFTWVIVLNFSLFITCFGKTEENKTIRKRWTIDKIIARVNQTNILKSDLAEPRIAKEGGTYSFQELITEELYFQKAAEKKLIPGTNEVDRQIVALKIQNNMTEMSDDAFEKELEQSGFTLQNYKHQLARVLAVENLKRGEVNEKIVITSQKVENYYKQNPYHPEQYLLSIVVLNEDEANNYKDLVKNKKVSWQELGWVEKKDLDARYSFVSSIKKRTISKPLKIDGNYRLVRLINKREKKLKSLDERYASIERILHDKQRDHFFSSFQEDLKNKASLISL